MWRRRVARRAGGTPGETKYDHRPDQCHVQSMHWATVARSAESRLGRSIHADCNSCSMLSAMADDPTTVSESIVAELADDETASMLAGQADVVDAVLAANRVFVAVAAGALANLEPEITLPQFRALVLIDIHRSMTVAELAEALGVVPSTATRMCDRLVSKELVDRTVDSANRRQMTLTLRAEGVALIAQSTRRRKREINRLLKSISPEAQADLATSLGTLVQAAHGSDRTRASRRLHSATGDKPPGQGTR